MDRQREMKAKAEEKSGRFMRKGVKTYSWERVLLLAAASSKRRNVGGSGAPASTPVLSWKQVEFELDVGPQNTIIKGKHPSFSLSSSSSAQVVSARRLAAALWEFQHYFSPATMYFGVNNPHRIRRHLHQRLNKHEPIDHHQNRRNFPFADSPDDHHPETAGNLRRQIAASLMQHKSTERNHPGLQPLSLASYGSSLEMAPYNPAATPGSSIELRGKAREASYGFKTSAELLKVLNRIWTLEEQHASNMALVKALKNELDHARSRIKALLRDQQANRDEINELMKQISEDNLSKKNQEQERIDAALQSIRNELEDERKLRKRSESLHRKLARELFEIKVALSTTAKELEKERKSSELLEELCDEFAKGIRDVYARQLHTAKQSSDKDWTVISDHENLLLHISESWLDERMQVKDKEPEGSSSQKSSLIDKLRHEIESFLSARKTGSSRDLKETRAHRYSLESIPEATTSIYGGHEDSTFDDTTTCADISKPGPSNFEEQEELSLSRRRKGQTPPSFHMSDIQSTPQETDPKKKKICGETSAEINMLQKSDIYDSIQETKERKKKGFNEEGQGSNSKTVDKLMSELLLAESGRRSSFLPEQKKKEIDSKNPEFRRNVSPVRQWMTSMKSPDPRISESSSKIQPVRDNTLKAKLQEPKTKGQRSRLKILRGL